MKYFFALIICLGTGFRAMAQKADVPDISGKWYSVLNVMGKKLRINLDLKKVNDTSYTGQLFSPDQSAEGVPLSRVALHGDTLYYEASAAGIKFQGVWDFRANAYLGNFMQGMSKFTTGYSREEITAADVKPNRPQTPKPPFPYLLQEVLVTNDSAKVTLAGTFTRPLKNKKYPVVIMITGSGPQDRDETLFDHKPFAVIADQLTRLGIAVLRYDDRGTGASTGKFSDAGAYDNASDVRSIIEYLRQRPDIDLNNIGLLGHSLGSEVAQIVAADNAKVAFVVSLCGAGIKGEDLLLKQRELIGRLSGAPDSLVKKSVAGMKPLYDVMTAGTDKNQISTKLTAILTAQYAELPASVKARVTQDIFIKATLSQLLRPEILSIEQYDPAQYLPRIHCPFLAIDGSKDLQVEATSNLKGIEAGLRKGGNNNITIRNFEGLNHLLQTCNSCTVEEYATLEETISPAVVDFISNWLTLLPELHTK